MKIGLVCPYNMLDRAGGVGEQVINLRAGLVKKGHKVKIITPRPLSYDGEAPPDYILLGTSAKFNGGLATDGTISFNVDNDEINQVLADEKFDVIHFHEPWAPILARQMLNSKNNSATVGTFHANLVDSAAAKSLVNLIAPYGRNVSGKLDAITAVSPASAQMLIEKVKEKVTNKIQYIPNGIDIKRYEVRPKDAVKHPKMKTIFYIGRLEGRKGVKYLLRAYNELTQRRDNVQLLIAGSGPDEERLRDYVKEFDVPRVTFLGFITDEEKIRQLHRADVFCSPATKGESFGVVLLEAMAANCPIVAGDNIGYLSVMKETGTISLVNPKDTVDFARRLEIMLFNEDIRRLWQTWAKNYVKQYDYKHIVEQYETVYREAIKTHGTKPQPKRRFNLRRHA